MPDYVGRCAVFKAVNESVYHNDRIIRVHFNENVLEGQFASWNEKGCIRDSFKIKKWLPQRFLIVMGQPF